MEDFWSGIFFSIFLLFLAGVGIVVANKEITCDDLVDKEIIKEVVYIYGER